MPPIRSLKTFLIERKIDIVRIVQILGILGFFTGLALAAVYNIFYYEANIKGYCKRIQINDIFYFKGYLYNASGLHADNLRAKINFEKGEITELKVFSSHDQVNSQIPNGPDEVNRTSKSHNQAKNPEGNPTRQAVFLLSRLSSLENCRFEIVLNGHGETKIITDILITWGKRGRLVIIVQEPTKEEADGIAIGLDLAARIKSLQNDSKGIGR